MPKTFWISTGNSRKETSWKNVELTWEQIHTRLSIPVVTAETAKEFSGFSKTLQDERKDVGGYVGGTITGGRRKKDAIVSRSLLTLDVDFAGPDFWEDFQEFFSCTALAHGTRKHGQKVKGVEQYRYRLIIPLAREVAADEYEAIGRKVAGILGIDLFDKTTFQPDRLMYWPSVSKDQDFYCRSQDGPLMDPDKVLAGYRDWRDQSQWPYASGVTEEVRGEVKQQADPLEKTGPVGAFCRSYTIAEAMEKFLPGIYIETEQRDRFTFAGGSTFAGLVVYDDKFAYSHHGTDPVGGHLVNAFDLVRIHKFGRLDGERDSDKPDRTNKSKKPSYLAMVEFINKDPAIVQEIMEERMARVKGLFDEDGSGDGRAETQAGRDGQRKGAGPETAGEGVGAIEAVEVDDNEWMGELEIDKKNVVITSYRNIELILENDKRIAGRIRYNELSRQTEVVKRLPWDLKGKRARLPREWNDDDWNLLRKMLGMGPYELLRSPKLDDCMSAVRLNNRYHPIKEYLEGLTWDGYERVNYVLSDYLGAEETEYVKTVTRKTLIAAVARVMTPGCKFDHVLTLVGKQGIGKSTLIKKLSKGWYTDTFSFTMLHNGNKAYEQIRGQWLVEIGEMAGLRKADIEASKSFISSTADSYRGAYKHEVEICLRQNIFIGSSNNPEFLRKFSGGNRRFWPVDCSAEPGKGGLSGKGAMEELTGPVVDQIWAEAVELWKQGEALYLSPEMEAEAFAVQQDHEEVVDISGIISEFLDTKLPENWDEKTGAERASFFKYRDELAAAGTIYRDKVCIPEIWTECMGKNKGDMTALNTKILHDVMKEMPGWFRCKMKVRFKEYGIMIGYLRKGSTVSDVAVKEL